jgi:hypothetical protein
MLSGHVQTSICSSICGSQTGTGDDDMRVLARRQLMELTQQQTLLRVMLAQDCADALIALQDILGMATALCLPVQFPKLHALTVPKGNESHDA